MRVAVVLEQRFDRTPDGRVWTEAAFGYRFWREYLRVFTAVLVVARVRDVRSEQETWTRADGEGVDFLTVPYYIGPGQFLSRAWKIRQTAKRAQWSREAVILRVPSQIANCFWPSLERMAHPYGVQVVGDPYEVFAPGAVRHALRPFFRWWFPFQLKKQCRGACACTYVTERTLQARYPAPSGASVSHCSDVLLPDEALLAASRRYGRPVTPRRVITVGSLYQIYKGVDVLIDAMALCAGWGLSLELTVIGDGRHRPELEARARRRGLAAHVRFAGVLSDAQAIRAHLDQADLFVLSSRTEGLPRVLLEAMARGLPCIGSAVGGIPELLAASDMAPAGDATALALKMQEVLDDPARLEAMSEQNLATAKRYRAEALDEKRDVFLRQVFEQTKRWMDRNPARLVVVVTTSPLALNAFFQNQVKFLVSRGFDILAVSSPGPQLDEFQSAAGIPVCPVPMVRRPSPLADLASLFALWRAFRRARPAIVHAHTPKAGLLAMLAAVAAGVKVRLYTIHGLPLVTRAGLQRRLLRWAEKLACAMATGVYCVSRSVRDLAEAEGIRAADRIRVLGDGSCAGIDLERFDPARHGAAARRETRARYGIPEEAVLIGYCGRLVREKGIGELSQAWASLRASFPAAHLLLCGEFEPQDPVPGPAIRLLEGDPRVHFTGGPVGDMPGIYAALDLCVLPSYREGLSTVLLECAAMQVPVVATRIPGCVDFIEDGVTGLLAAPRDASALEQATARLIRNPDLARRMAGAARAFVTARYSERRVSELLAGEYQRLLSPTGEPRMRFQATLKRIADVAGAGLLLILLAPVLALAAAAIGLTMGRPVLFRQSRGGWKGRPFQIYKFRTMTDARQTRLGRVLRRTSIDELPQLWNVLKGEMSLVGPRPLLASYLDRYDEAQRRRHEVRPGITGWAQIHGRNAISWEERFNLDVWYARNWTLRLDLVILARTVASVLRANGAESNEFLGNRVREGEWTTSS